MRAERYLLTGPNPAWPFCFRPWKRSGNSSLPFSCQNPYLFALHFRITKQYSTIFLSCLHSIFFLVLMFEVGCMVLFLFQFWFLEYGRPIPIFTFLLFILELLNNTRLFFLSSLDFLCLLRMFWGGLYGIVLVPILISRIGAAHACGSSWAAMVYGCHQGEDSSPK